MNTNAERVKLFQAWLDADGNYLKVDANDILSWIGQSDLEVEDVFDIHGDKMLVFIGGVLLDAESHDANKRDVDRSLRPRAERLQK